MDVILHIGAHRTATTTFQHYMRGQSSELARAGIGFWGPWRTRGGLFSGVMPGPVAIGGGDPARRAAVEEALGAWRALYCALKP